MEFNKVHEIELNVTYKTRLGRLRVRSRSKMTRTQAYILQKELSKLEGIRKVHINYLSGSVLFFYESFAARNEAIKLLTLDIEKVLATPLLPQEVNRIPQIQMYHFINFLLIMPIVPLPIRKILTFFKALPFIARGFASLSRKKCDVELLDATAIVASMLANDFPTAGMTIFLLQTGEMLEEWVKHVSTQTLEESLALNISHVWVLRENKEIEVPFSEVKKGDTIIVRTGSMIPVDGLVLKGEAMVNQAAMTGEAMGVHKTIGASVFAGTALDEGEIFIEVKKIGENTRIQKILQNISTSEKTKAKIQGKSERLADFAVPFTFAFSALVFLFTRNFMRATAVLAVDYACALRLATPLIMLTAMKDAANNGILIKGGRYLEELAEANMIVFDKTGTLTSAEPKVCNVIAADGFERKEVLRLAACLEEHFPHPVARAVVRAAEEEDLQHKEQHTQVKYILAHGIESEWNNKRVLIGSRHFIEQDNCIDLSSFTEEAHKQSEQGHSLLYLAIGEQVAGLIVIEDPLRQEAIPVIRYFQAQGMQVVMLTGDDEKTAKAIAEKTGVDYYKSEILPEGKDEIIKLFQDKGYKILMVGDGINDSPALSRANAGISLSDGTDLAQEVANIVLMHPRLDNIVSAKYIAQRALERIHTNYTITLLLNTLFMLGGATAILNVAATSVLHNATTVGTAILAIRPIVPKKYRGE